MGLLGQHHCSAVSWAYHIFLVSSSWQLCTPGCTAYSLATVPITHLSEISSSRHIPYTYERSEYMICTPKLNNSFLLRLMSLILMFVFDRANILHLHYTERQFFQPLSKNTYPFMFSIYFVLFFKKSGQDLISKAILTVLYCSPVTCMIKESIRIFFVVVLCIASQNQYLILSGMQFSILNKIS